MSFADYRGDSLMRACRRVDTEHCSIDGMAPAVVQVAVLTVRFQMQTRRFYYIFNLNILVFDHEEFITS